MRELVLEEIPDTPVVPNPINSLFVQSPFPPDNSNLEPVPFTLTISSTSITPFNGGSPLVPYISPYDLQIQERRAKKVQQKKDKYEKKLIERKRYQQETAERQLAHERLKLHVKQLFTYKRPPLISLRSASVGHSKRRNFTQELDDEFTDTLRPISILGWIMPSTLPKIKLRPSLTGKTIFMLI
ncbi:hypothetical protein C1645_858737 [Glomus cerebriforme]|uniref:Uncharacterized protein n=1 Tax=Glomus cerebriforme TaxID=658196 RepID=A0A397SGQ4_9GLOM|nr:hypothetical protein C1645_858737 [Glomus cerebriforme]